jgi:hypothetical protein
MSVTELRHLLSPRLVVHLWGDVDDHRAAGEVGSHRRESGRSPPSDIPTTPSCAASCSMRPDRIGVTPRAVVAVGPAVGAARPGDRRESRPAE